MTERQERSLMVEALNIFLPNVNLISFHLFDDYYPGGGCLQRLRRLQVKRHPILYRYSYIKHDVPASTRYNST
jgi:hypothetical protein